MVIDGINQSVSLSNEQIQKLSCRHFGVGFDQLLLIEKATDPQCHFYYRIFNADGGEVEQCGNGARCVAKYARDNGLVESSNILAQTITRVLALNIEDNGDVSVDMGAAQISQSDKTQGIISMGNPHFVTRVDDVRKLNIDEEIKNKSDDYNVGFMQIINRDFIRLRVYERGVGETLACGSGACAAVAFGNAIDELSPIVKVELKGGSLKIDCQNENIIMTGPAKTVFEGVVDL